MTQWLSENIARIDSMKFEPITPENARWVERVYAGDVEKFWLYTNDWWYALSQQNKGIACELISVEGLPEPVSFIAYGMFYEDAELTQRRAGWYEIIHLVIHQPYQRRGYGVQATRLAIERLRAQPDCQAIVIAHNPENLGARRLYERLGFVEIGQNYDGDPLLQLVDL